MRSRIRKTGIISGSDRSTQRTYYHSIILPAKLRLDREYAAHSTVSSDLRLIRPADRKADDVE
jgi:hypothetical protein